MRYSDYVIKNTNELIITNKHQFVQLKSHFSRLTSIFFLLNAITMKNILQLAVVFSFLLLNFANAQTIHFQEDFNTGLPATWTVTPSGNATQTWDSTSIYYSFSFDATKYMIVYDWNGLITNEILTSPAFNATSAGDPVLLIYDFKFLYQSTVLQGFVDVYDGSAWQNVRLFENADTTGIDTIDISTYANAAMQVRFRFVNAVGNNWEHAFMIDNVKVCEFPTTTITEDDSDSHLPYPNPAVHLLTLKDTNKDDIDFVGIYSVKGDLIKVCEKDINVDISDLTPGSYILRVIVNGVFADDMLFIKQ